MGCVLLSVSLSSQIQVRTRNERRILLVFIFAVFDCSWAVSGIFTQMAEWGTWGLSCLHNKGDAPALD